MEAPRSKVAPASEEIPDSKPQRRIGRHLIFGFLMGSADLVPGVSGGTVALACGIYPRLIRAIRRATGVLVSLGAGRPAPAIAALRRLDWALLIPLLTGILLAVIALASAVEHLLKTVPVRMGGLFLGLVLGSVIVATGMIRRMRPGILLIIAVSALAVFAGLGLVTVTHAPAPGTADVALWAYPAAGALAICAMILPGVSGSFMLLVVGMYDTVLAAVNNRSVLPLLLFVAGCVLGLALFSRLLFWLIERHHDPVVAAMIGLMLGSVRILWPWPGGPLTNELGAPLGDVLIPSLLALAGLVAVVVAAKLGGIGEESPGLPENREDATG
ncbi:MAG: DUF368 domain-containing protein [Actinomycetota bacterium]